jgi:hypothetical protein
MGDLSSENMRVLCNELERRFRRVLSDMMREKYVSGRYSDVEPQEWQVAKEIAVKHFTNETTT